MPVPLGVQVYRRCGTVAHERQIATFFFLLCSVALFARMVSRSFPADSLAPSLNSSENRHNCKPNLRLLYARASLRTGVDCTEIPA